MTDDQLKAIRCALADLTGAWQAMNQGDYSIHDWESHEATIFELAAAFNLEDELPRELREDQEEYCYHCFIHHDGEVSDMAGHPESGCADYCEHMEKFE